MELYYATGNSDKYETVHRYLERNAPHIQLKPCTHDFIEIQSYDQKLVALDKARQAWNFLKKPVLIDDAGIYFEKYRDFPGVFTKYVYRGIGMDGLRKLVASGDAATFRLHMVYWHGPEEYQVFVGECPGFIVHQTEFTASEHSPYDQIFAPAQEPTTSYAQLHAIGQYEKYHYRLAALQKFLHWLTVQK